MEPYELTITEADAMLAEKKLSSVELIRSCLEHIERTEKNICSFISIDPDQALEAAAEADLSRQRGEGGSLCGIPLSIKDLLCTKDRTTTCGSKILENFAPPYDATVVEKLNAHGAVIVGKAAMDEFAMGSSNFVRSAKAPLSQISHCLSIAIPRFFPEFTSAAAPFLPPSRHLPPPALKGCRPLPEDFSNTTQPHPDHRPRSHFCARET